jgi:pimeloyl-ACP methyl ester carboxylesterase
MRVDSDGVGIEVEVTGTGRPVVLLHGFPDTGALWRNQVPALVEAGFSTIVPDLRGYGKSDKPEGVDPYSIPYVVGDVLNVLDSLGIERAHVVGHDWGAAIAWAIGSLVPDRVEQLVALSVGHPSSFAEAGYEQREKSWYMLLFQFEGIAEKWLSNNDWANLRSWGQHPDVDTVIAELERSGSLTPALSYYRANVGPQTLIDAPLELPDVQASSMGVWSTGDIALTEKQMTGSADHVSGTWRYERIDGPGHWMQLEAPALVNELLLDFLTS